MKNQYYGDINDFKKYSLIKHLAGEGEMQTAICWALTKDDERPDGSRINYLKEPQKWRRYDPVVFDKLRSDILVKGERKVESIEKSDIFSTCRFFNHSLADGEQERNKFFQDFDAFSQSTNLLFFDPDNGIEIKSVPRGRSNSSKYIYWKELKEFYRSGKSILIYQHFPRRNRERFIDNVKSRVFEETGSSLVFLYVTSNVLFLLIPQKEHGTYFRRKNHLIAKNWKNLIIVKECSIYGYSKQISVNPIINSHVESYGT